MRYNIKYFTINDGGYMKSNIIKIGALGLASIMTFESVGAGSVFAQSSNFDLRKKVIGLTGITFVSGNIDRFVTRDVILLNMEYMCHQPLKINI